jgi:hypothetical protein
VAKILANLARNYSRTVCATIHQPSSEIYQCFDDLVLLADGHVGGACCAAAPVRRSWLLGASSALALPSRLCNQPLQQRLG